MGLGWGKMAASWYVDNSFWQERQELSSLLELRYFHECVHSH